MPLVWKVDDDDRLMVCVGHGDVIRAEVESYLDAIVARNALGYRRLFDVHAGDTKMTADDVLPIALRMQALQKLGRMGPLAVVLPEGRGKRLQRGLGMVATADRPMRVFEYPVLACRWLGKQDVASETEDRGSPEWRAQTRYLAAGIRRLASQADAEATAKQPFVDALLYRGHNDIVHDGKPLNVCVRQSGAAWEFLCCNADRVSVGSLLTLGRDEIVAAMAQGENPLAATIARLKGLAQSGELAIKDVPSNLC